MEGFKIQDIGKNRRYILRLLPTPFRTYIPRNTPKWFTDYVDCVNKWTDDAHKEILQLHLKIKKLEDEQNRTIASTITRPLEGDLPGNNQGK